MSLRGIVGVVVSVDVAALIWPAVILILAFVFKEPIRDMARSAGQRGFKIGLPGGLEFELPAARESSMSWQVGADNTDLRRPTSSTTIVDNTVEEFAKQLDDTTPADFAMVDLGCGQEWLTSRLYFMSFALARTRGLQAFAFQASAREGGSTRFVGWSRLTDVRWALARAFPYLEEALTAAKNELAAQANLVVVRGGAVAAVPARPGQIGNVEHAYSELLRLFLSKIQAVAFPPNEINDWVPLQSPPASAPAVSNTREHARWLDEGKLRTLLASNLVTSSIRKNELLSKPDAQQAAMVAGHEGRYVALTLDNGELAQLVDREAMLTRQALGALRVSNQRA